MARSAPKRKPAKLQPTSLESQFYRIWQLLGGPELVWQHRFHPTRQWRFDYAEPTSKVAIELQGGTWQRGWHQNPIRYTEDCTKLNAAASLGWRVFWLTSEMLLEDPVGQVGQIIAATGVSRKERKSG